MLGSILSYKNLGDVLMKTESYRNESTGIPHIRIIMTPHDFVYLARNNRLTTSGICEEGHIIHIEIELGDETR